jgi:hypothetical protein
MAGTVLSGELGGNYPKVLMGLGEKVMEGGWFRIGLRGLCVRARLQSCRKALVLDWALAPATAGTGAKALIFGVCIAARLKSCPDTKPRHETSANVAP